MTGLHDAESQGRVLLVDDEPDILLEMREALEDEGFEVYSAGGVDEALALMASMDTVAVIVTDLKMPLKSGYDLIRSVRQQTRLKPQIIIMSGHGGAEHELESEGVLGYTLLRKPLDINELVDKVEAANRMGAEP